MSQIDSLRWFIVLFVSITVAGVASLLLRKLKASNWVYYVVFPAIMFLSGYSYAWASPATDPRFNLLMALASALLGLQGAWVLTTRLPRS
jgi:hypothetical protein